MARALLTPSKSSEGTTAAPGHIMAAASTDGYYIKTTGVDATGLVLLITRSTDSSDTAEITIISGSTAGNEDFEPGTYSTRRNLSIDITTSTAASTRMHIIPIAQTARYKDTDGYIKVDLSTELSGGTVEVGAIFIVN
jgi:hypothetical protein